MQDRRQHPRRDVLSVQDAERVGDVFTQYQRFIENVAKQYAFHQDDVPDIVQAVGVQVCRGLNGFRGDSELTTWLYRVTVNTSRDHYRRERRFQRSREAMAQALYEGEAVMDPDDQVEASQQLDAVFDATARLRPHHQTALRDLVRNCTGAPEVSLDGPTCEGTRKSRLFRARRELRSVLADDPRFED
jgi:RNA polymerase sigma-70 factor (ECF subfamily)